MNSIIHLLPDSVANQIAAGEVIQRPASVVKELVENSVDAGADVITVNIKDAGKTLIQVIDNGRGMSETDARLCWERHATSKIVDANDLFSIRTKGFRGEALASIAAIAEVGLKTREKESELGTQIKISGSEILSNEPVSCQEGCSISVKNLFFNVPARRRFLKSNSTELRHIINEFNHIALAHPSVEFALIHNNSQIFSLPKTNRRQRIIHIFGKNFNQNLIPVNADTTLISIEGFIGKPEFAKKSYGEQFFFVNDRYIRHPYFHKAVLQSYDKLLPSDSIPSYFIFLGIDPSKIDINIHPTKTEIKFEDERALWQILHAVIKESIGKHNLSPSLDFGNEGVVDIPVLRRNTEINSPGIELNPDFNPFENAKPDRSREWERIRSENAGNWESLFGQGQSRSKDPDNNIENGKIQELKSRYLQFKNKYILISVKSGLMVVDQKRAHERVLFEKLLSSGKNRIPGQTMLFPETIELNPADFVTLKEIREDINRMGFDISEFGNHSVIVNAVPDTVKNSDLSATIEKILEDYRSTSSDVSISKREKLAISLAGNTAIGYGKILEQEEMRVLIDQLFACSNPNYSPSGKPVLNIIETDAIEKSFKR